MADVFISYARSDREFAALIAEAIERGGLSVWWDRKVGVGKSFSAVIEQQLDAARCVVVLWSHASLASEWVLNEAAEGARRRILVPICIEDVRPPLEFRRLQTATILSASAISSPEFLECVSSIRELGLLQPSVSEASAAESLEPGPTTFPDLARVDTLPGKRTSDNGVIARLRLRVFQALMVVVTVVILTLPIIWRYVPLHNVSGPSTTTSDASLHLPSPSPVDPQNAKQKQLISAATAPITTTEMSPEERDFEANRQFEVFVYYGEVARTVASRYLEALTARGFETSIGTGHKAHDPRFVTIYYESGERMAAERAGQVLEEALLKSGHKSGSIQYEERKIGKNALISVFF